MSHSALHLNIMFDWLRVCEDEGRLPPSYPEIAARFEFDNREQPQTLIAALSDAGRIKIKPAGFDRFSFVICSIKPRGPFIPVRHNRDIEGSHGDVGTQDVDECIAKIKMTLGKRKTAMPIMPTLRPKPAPPRVFDDVKATPEPILSDPPINIPEPFLPVAAPPIPEPAIVVPNIDVPVANHDTHPVREPLPEAVIDQLSFKGQVEHGRKIETKPVREAAPHQLNIKVSAEHFAVLTKLASEKRIPTGTLVRSVFADYMNGAAANLVPAPKPTPKPRVPAAVTAAWLNDGRAFDVFMTDMLSLGVEALLAARSGR
jgi:hypothetical protein